MTYEEALGFIKTLEVFRSIPGLERIKKLLDLLGNPQDKLNYIHITGTNGKGSVTAMLSSIYKEAGYKTGMYTSPYVADFRERFQINGEMISKERFAFLMGRIVPLVKKLGEEGVVITEFEIITTLAFLYFYEENCDIVCLEVGMGGEHDATNVIPAPHVAVITPVSVDHEKYLGETPEKIAILKAGIIKPGAACVCYPVQEAEVMAVLYKRCAETGAALIQPSKDAAAIISEDLTGTLFFYGGREYKVPFIGRHQVLNAVTVIEAVNAAKSFPVSPKDLENGVKAARLPARLEVFGKNPLIILDGAHNLSGMEALCDVMDMVPQMPKIAVVGMLKDKAYDACMQRLCRSADTVIAADVENERALSAKSLAETAGKYKDDVLCIASGQEALEKAVSLAGENGLVAAGGSLYLASALRPLIMKMGK